jgi:hypothetical protein
VVLTAALYEATLFSLPGATGPGVKNISLIDPCTGAPNVTETVTTIFVHAIVAPVATANALVSVNVAHIPRLILDRPLQSQIFEYTTVTLTATVLPWWLTVLEPRSQLQILDGSN